MDEGGSSVRLCRVVSLLKKKLQSEGGTCIQRKQLQIGVLKTKGVLWCFQRALTVLGGLSNVVVLVLVILVPLHVVTIDQRFDSLFQVGRLPRGKKFKDTGQLLKIRMTITLTLTGKVNCLYSSLMSRLWLSVFLIFMMRTIAASIWYCRSW